jgi:hypothetical protein
LDISLVPFGKFDSILRVPGFDFVGVLFCDDEDGVEEEVEDK